MAPEKLVIIDGHSLAFRAFHALPPSLHTSRGELTNAIYGFTSMLLNVLRDEKPDYIVVTFDVGKSFRHQEYPQYKAHRLKPPEEFSLQLERIRQLVEAFHIPVIVAEGYEADDVLGTLARQAAAQGIETLIVTGDTDAFQLVGPHVKVLTSRRKFSDTVVYDEERIRERYGLSPQQLIDFKALVGDKSDNIPGVPGIGEKTAAKLLQKYGSLEGIYEHLDEISSKKVRQALETHREQAFLSKRLVRIATDAPVKLDLTRCRVGRYDRDEVIRLFRELEFRSLMNRLPEVEPEAAQLPLLTPEPTAPSPLPTTCHLITDQAALEKLVATLEKAPAIAFDTETTSTRPVEAGLVGISLSIQEGEGYYIPISQSTILQSTTSQPPSLFAALPEEPSPSSGPQLPLDIVIEKLRPVLEDPRQPKYAHNGGFDYAVLAQHGLRVQNLAFDTMIAAWLLDPASRNLGLKDLAWAKLGVDMTPITALIGKGKKQISMAQVPVEQVAPYAAADADMTYRLVKVLEPELKEKALWKLFVQVEMPLVPVLAEMELAGVKLDVDYLRRMSKELEEQLRELEKRIYQEAGVTFNIGSTQQLSQVLFERLKLPTKGIKKTKSGRYSTGASELEKLRGQHPVVDLILEHRQLAKIKSTYVDALPALVNPRTGRVHTSFNQTGTVTGRISSSEPNLQNIPIRTEVGRRVRRAFVAEEGWLLLGADYSQIELRVLAHISKDPALLEAFRRGEDIHTATAVALFGVPPDQVTREQRRIAKTINFAIIYGVSGWGLSQQADITPEEGEELIQQYFRHHPKVKEYIERTKRQAKEQGYVETLLGRRRYFPEFKTKDKAHAGLRRAAERMAINAPIQGSASDIIKIAMIRLYRAMKERGLRSRMILQVHDELVLEVPRQELEEVKPLVRGIMEGAMKLDIPLKVDMEIGPNWLDMEKVGK